MRLWAWSHFLQLDEQTQMYEVRETYPCLDTCLGADGQTSGPRGRKKRDYWRCALPEYPSERWGEGPTPDRLPRYMGRLRVLADETDNHPKEPHDDGCPGAWYRCAFVYSLHRYERLLTEAGFSDNLLLSRSDDRLLLEALHYYEREKLAARAHNREQINKANPR